MGHVGRIGQEAVKKTSLLDGREKWLMKSVYACTLDKLASAYHLQIAIHMCCTRDLWVIPMIALLFVAAKLLFQNEIHFPPTRRTL